MKQLLKKDALRRMNIINGQVKNISKMIENEQYCPDIITQSLAVQNALKQVDAKILEGHLQTCTEKLMQKGETKKATDEILKLFQFSKKNS